MTRKKTDPALIVMTRREAEQHADGVARQLLGVTSRKDAFRMLDNGELDGTAAEAVFSGLQHLLQEKG